MHNLELQASDGHRLGAYRADPTTTTPRGALVVLQEIFGVNSHIRAVADGFAADGWAAIAPALFDRVERGIEIGYSPEDVQRGMQLRAGCTNETTLLDIAATVAAVQSVGRVGVIGYCWGGTLAWLAAARQPGLAGAVAYYGGGIRELLDIEPLCPVLAHFGDRDTSIPLSVSEDMRKKHPQVEVHVYPAGHGFNCDQRGSFDAPSARLARERTLKFLREHV